MGLTCEELADGFPEYEFVEELGGGTFKLACLVVHDGQQVVLKVSKATIDKEPAESQSVSAERSRR